jgi:hypothetical protein
MSTEKDVTFLQDLTGIIRKHFAAQTRPVEQKFKELKTADGTAVIAYEGETPEVGMAVVAIVNGEQLSVPDGVHTMEDGSKIETKDSFIVAIAPAETKPEENGNPAEVEAKKENPAPVASPSQLPMKEVETLIREKHFEAIKPVTEKLEELQKENVTLKAENATLKEAVAAHSASLETLTEKFGKYEKFYAEISELLSKPQEEVKQIEKQFSKDEKPQAAKLSHEEWQKKYMTH